MSSSVRDRTARLRGAPRPIAALVAAVVGLGLFGGATGMALGAVGATPTHMGGHLHHDNGPGRGPGRPGR